MECTVKPDIRDAADAKFSALLAIVPEAILTINADQRIESFNHGAEQIFGFTMQEVIGQSLDILLPLRFAKSHRAQVENFSHTSDTARLMGHRQEIIGMRKDKTEFPAEASIGKLNFEGSTMFIVVLRDISERKQQEQEREALHSQLVKLSRQVGQADVATNMLHHLGNMLNSMNISLGVIINALQATHPQDLGKISYMLQVHNEDLGHFLSNDNKGKLIPGYLAQLSDYLFQTQKSALEELESVRQSIEDIDRFVQMQKDLAQTYCVKEATEIPDLIEEALTKIDPSLFHEGIDVTRQYEKVPEIMTDKHQVLQVLRSLISNALESMLNNNGRPHHLRLRIQSLEEESMKKIIVEVGDTGRGLDSEQLARVFSQNAARHHYGNELSLHDCAVAMNLLNGSIRAESAGRGKGTNLVLELPIDTIQSENKGNHPSVSIQGCCTSTTSSQCSGE